jgi:hypothetical protein
MGRIAFTSAESYCHHIFSDVGSHKVISKFTKHTDLAMKNAMPLNKAQLKSPSKFFILFNSCEIED